MFLSVLNKSTQEPRSMAEMNVFIDASMNQKQPIDKHYNDNSKNNINSKYNIKDTVHAYNHRYFTA